MDGITQMLGLLEWETRELILKPVSHLKAGCELCLKFAQEMREPQLKKTRSPWRPSSQITNRDWVEVSLLLLD